MKKLCVLLISGLMLVTSVPTYGFAATEKAQTVNATTAVNSKTVAEPNVKNTTEPTDAALKNAILAVKDKITIPKEYSIFNYYYYASNSYREAYWNLMWSNPDTGANIAVNCDLDYHITNFDHNDYKLQNSGISKYLKSELQKKAEDFTGKIAPQTKGHLKFVNSMYSSIYSGNYVYNYIRTENGVDFPDNNVSVFVSSITGEATSITVNWIYDFKIPAADMKLTKDDATASIKKNMKMKLVYKTRNYVIYDKTDDASKIKAFLVYEPSKDYISVDAKTGKLYTSKTEWRSETNTTSKEDAKMASTADKGGGGISFGSSLSDDEIAKINELKNIITKSKAIKLVADNSSLYKDKNLTKYSATLQQWYDETSTTKYVWYVTLNDPRKVTDKDSYRGYANATVDAETGKILSYNASMKSNYNEDKQKWNSVKIKYNKNEGKKILEKFLKSQMNNRFSNTVISKQTNDYIAYYKKEEPIYGGYSYRYNRVNSGIEFVDNFINGAVDGVTGKIYSINSNWNTNVTFEAATGTMSADDAMKSYLSKDGYGLKYEINQINKNTKNSDRYLVDYEIRLVYRPDIDPCYISPFTGEQLNWNGEVYKKTTDYVYKDVANTEANRNILLLADMNIGFAGDNFLPSQNITLGEVKTLLTSVGYGYATIEGNDADLITREELAQLFITWINLDKMAKLNIYNPGYSDSNAIDSKYVGAVALAKGLGIMDGDSGNFFNPKKNVTRYDAVNYILNFIDLQRKGLW